MITCLKSGSRTDKTIFGLIIVNNLQMYFEMLRKDKNQIKDLPA